MTNNELKHAIALHDSIEKLDAVETIFKRKRWDVWTMNDHFESTHFSLLKHYGDDSSEIILPKELNELILELISDYNNKLKKEFEKL